MKRCAFTFDLEPEYAGQVGRSSIFECKDDIRKVLDILTRYGIKPTVFSVGQVLKKRPDIIALFETIGSEFEIHSYSHNRQECDTWEDLIAAKKAYNDYFKRDPIGYRAPCGRITKEFYDLLMQGGFQYDSSVFPSYYPNPMRYLFKKREIHHIDNTNLIEIPITSISPFRLTFSLSYIKLFGFDFYRFLIRCFGLPNFVCFSAHLHDFIVCEESFQELPIFWRNIYRRNKYNGYDVCKEVLELLHKSGYTFCLMSEACEQFKRHTIGT